MYIHPSIARKSSWSKEPHETSESKAIQNAANTSVTTASRCLRRMESCSELCVIFGHAAVPVTAGVVMALDDLASVIVDAAFGKVADAEDDWLYCVYI